MTEQNWQDVYYSAQDGLTLHVRDYGSRIAHLPPLVCLPGLTRNARDFHDLATYFSAQAETSRRVCVFDYRGRGLSAHDANWENYTILQEMHDVHAGMAALGLEHAVFLGTSRGGLITMMTAAVQPTLIAAAILNDIGPEIEPKGLVRIKGYVGHGPSPSNWDDAATYSARIHGAQFPDKTHEDWLAYARAIYREENGKLVADYDPALFKTLEGISADAPVPTLWPQFRALSHCPVLAIRGEHSDILSYATLDKMADCHPDFEEYEVPQEGHAPFLNDDASLTRIDTFLQKLG